ncbi:hypothetical protein [Hymenobacter sp.]|jgi:hypothetical protein|uniref:hypothetical protein n=1 Tax=Hymenobacter sp. TaxID=1898978 RepID=UPI002EDAD95C
MPFVRSFSPAGRSITHYGHSAPPLRPVPRSASPPTPDTAKLQHHRLRAGPLPAGQPAAPTEAYRSGPPSVGRPASPHTPSDTRATAETPPAGRLAFRWSARRPYRKPAPQPASLHAGQPDCAPYLRLPATRRCVRPASTCPLTDMVPFGPVSIGESPKPPYCPPLRSRLPRLPQPEKGCYILIGCPSGALCGYARTGGLTAGPRSPWPRTFKGLLG